MLLRIIAFVTAVVVSTVALGQEDLRGTSWVQIEARPSQQGAADRASDLSANFENVNAFYLGSGWYGIALGPFESRNQATTVLRNLRRARSIPADSFVAAGSAFRERIWPPANSVEIPADTPAEEEAEPTSEPEEPVVAETVESEPTPTDIAEETSDDAVTPAPQQEEIEIALPADEPDETPRQARASERKLNDQEKRDLQRALKWAGHYTGRIDGKYGKGTRRAMGLWQRAKSYDVSGILTTRQRKELMEDYDTVLDGMTFETRTLESAGIEVNVPQGIFAAETFDAPLIRFEPNTDFDAKLILISQATDRDGMEVLFEVLKTLEIVPVVGNHRLTRNGFEIDGRSNRWRTRGFARLQSGQLKGAILVWPAKDEERQGRVQLEVFRSFKRLTGVLDAAAFSTDEEAEALSGLPVRKPSFVQSGLFADAKGNVLTASSNLGSCARIGLGESAEGEVLASNELATIIRPIRPLSPLSVPEFQSVKPKAPSQIVVGGYSYGGLLGAPTLTFGELSQLTDLTGDETKARLSVETLPGDVGAPIFDRGGAVVGILLPRKEDGVRQLPASTQFAALWDEVSPLLKDAKARPKTTETLAYMHPEDISALARDATVLISCWE